MSYSNIAKNHISRLKSILVTTKEIDKAKNKLPPGHTSHDLYNLALKGSLVSSFSEVETYLESFISECFEKGLKKTDYDSFFKKRNHKNLKAYYFSLMYKEFFHSFSFTRSEADLIKKIANSPHFAALLNGGPFSMSGGLLPNGKKYPSAKNLKSIGMRIGIDNIFNEMGKLKPLPWSDKVDSMADTRGTVAHRGELPAGYSSADAVNFISDSIILIQYLDRAFKKHLKSNISARDWSEVCKI